MVVVVLGARNVREERHERVLGANVEVVVELPVDGAHLASGMEEALREHEKYH